MPLRWTRANGFLQRQRAAHRGLLWAQFWCCALGERFGLRGVLFDLLGEELGLLALFSCLGKPPRTRKGTYIATIAEYVRKTARNLIEPSSFDFPCPWLQLRRPSVRQPLRPARCCNRSVRRDQGSKAPPRPPRPPNPKEDRPQHPEQPRAAAECRPPTPAGRIADDLAVDLERSNPRSVAGKG